MVTASWFVTATEARNNIVKDIAVHGEISAIETEILLAVQRGDYEVTVSSQSVITENSGTPTQVFDVNSVTNILHVPNHGWSTGTTVTVTSTQELPPPLTAGVFYYVIFVDQDHIRLATSLINARAGQSISIDITQGVTSVNMSQSGSGYTQAPVVSFVGGDPVTTAAARAELVSHGSLASVSVLGTSGGFVCQPSVTVLPAGSAAEAGAVTFRTISASVAFGGTNYNVNDLLYVLTGSGTQTVLRVAAVNGGTVSAVSIVTAGNYTTLPTLLGSITSTDGTGGGCSVNLVMGVSSIGVQTSGTGYAQPPRVIISDGGGSGAQAVASLAGGTVIGFVVTQRGTGYTEQPTVTITSGSDASAVVQLAPTTVANALITNNGGTNYVNPPTVDLTITQGNSATAGTVTLTAVRADIRNPGLGYTLGDILLVSGGVATQSTNVQVTAINAQGQITQINTIVGGSYTTLPELVASTVLGGTGSGASVDLVMGVGSIAVAAPGVDYVIPPAVIITGDATTPASAYTNILAGTVTAVVISHAGSGYTQIPTVELTLGSGATAVAVLQASTVAPIQILDGGSGYTSVPLISIQGGGGTGAAAQAVLSGESVVDVILTNAGSGYTSSPSISIEGNAQLDISIVPVAVSEIVITDPGSNYIVEPTVTISGSATALAQLAATSVAAIRVTDQGVNYTANPLITLVPGAAQTTTPVYPITQANRSFGVQSVVVTHSGDAYTSVPSVQFSATGVSGSGAQATAILGSGTGTLGIVKYTASRDYWMVWQQCAPSNRLLMRPYADQMNAVIKYFDDLGYTITRSTNPVTGNTIEWVIKW